MIICFSSNGITDVSFLNIINLVYHLRNYADLFNISDAKQIITQYALSGIQNARLTVHFLPRTLCLYSCHKHSTPLGTQHNFNDFFFDWPHMLNKEIIRHKLKNLLENDSVLCE